MNAENFPDFLLDNGKLWQLNYQELKTLYLQHPYCANIALLLLKKGRLENAPETDTQLHLTAALVPDRAFLYEQLQELEEEQRQEEKLFKEDMLELLDLNALKEALPQKTSDNTPTTPAKLHMTQLQYIEHTTSDDSTAPPPIASAKLHTPQHQAESHKTKSDQKTSKKKSDIPTASAKSPPTTKTFAYQKPELGEILRKHKQLFVQEKTPAEEAKWEELEEPRRLATESVQQKEAVISETLARILALQGHSKKAIAMYEQLRLLNPKKSAYFAAQIDLLKKKTKK